MAPRKPVARKARSKRLDKGGGAPGGKAGRRASRTTGDPALLGELEALAALMDQHGLLEVSYDLRPDGSKSIHVSRNARPALAHAAPVPAGPAPVAAAPPEPAGPPAAAEDLHAFRSPMVGTFYRAPSPEAPAFANVGDAVSPASVVCIIEAMKVMNEINPDAGGEIVSIEVENGEAVEFGQTLMLIRRR